MERSSADASRLGRVFGLAAAGTSVRREVVAGLTTFATLSYILFVQPAVLAHPACGMDAAGVLFATAVASAAACFLMAWWANWPIALAPAMGHNFFFVYTVCLARGFRWQEALAANFVAGVLFLALSGTRLRERVLAAIPEHLQHAIGAGIGLLIALVGLEWGGLVVAHPGTLVGLSDLAAPAALLTLFGLATSAVLLARGVPGAFLIGILASACAGWAATAWFELAPPLVRVAGVVGPMPSPGATAFHLDFAGLLARPPLELASVVATFFVLVLFDTVGTLVGVGARAGWLVDGRLPPRARGAFAADAAGTVIGSALGTSTVTCYVESAAGIAAGGRTGLTAVVVGLCLLASLFFTPLIAAVGGGVVVGGGAEPVVLHPLLAPVLILVGVLMAGGLARIDWNDLRRAIPAFLTVVVMQLSVSITDGIAWGFLATSVLDLLAPGERRAGAFVHALAALFLLRYLFLG